MQSYYDVLAYRLVHCSAEHSLRNACIRHIRIICFIASDCKSQTTTRGAQRAIAEVALRSWLENYKLRSIALCTEKQ